MLLFVDSETTGIPKFGQDNPADGDGQPRLCQIGMLQVEPASLEIADRFACLVKPDGWEVPADALAIHGLTTERLTAEGGPVSEACAAFEAFHERSTEIVCYGGAFDLKILRGELRRLGCSDHYAERPVVDVMRALNPHTKLPMPNGRGGLKLPRLSEASEILLGRPHPKPHDAMADCEELLELYRWLDKQGCRPVGKLPKKREAA